MSISILTTDKVAVYAQQIDSNNLPTAFADPPTFESSDPTIAVLSDLAGDDTPPSPGSYGRRLTAIAPGEVTLTVTGDSGLIGTNTCTVNTASGIADAIRVTFGSPTAQS